LKLLTKEAKGMQNVFKGNYLHLIRKMTLIWFINVATCQNEIIVSTKGNS